MKNFHSIEEFSRQNKRPTVVTIGNFDGCHKGHQLLIDEVKRVSSKLDASPIALTFSPSPKEYFGVMNRTDRIFTDEMKSNFFELSKLDSAIFQSFDDAFSKISSTEFIENELLTKLNAVGLVVGDNFRFGYKAQGTTAFLKEYFVDKKSFSLSIIDHETTDSESVISSTLIRSSIRDANLSRVKDLLGRQHIIGAKVAHGKKLGKTIGFPTANLTNIEQILPKTGVYSGWLVENNQLNLSKPLDRAMKAVANIGINPTTDITTSQKFEVHVLNRNDLELYNSNVYFIFDKFIRAEKKFDSLNALISQIKHDCEQAEINLN